MTALLERHGELDALQRGLSAAADGHGAMAIVLGQPGLGKTRLLEAARTLGEQAGLRVVEGRGAELESSFPFGVVRQLLEPVVTDLDAEERDAAFGGPAQLARPLFEYPMVRQGQASGNAERFAAVHGLYWLVVNLSSARPMALVVDDAHWADEPSLRFVDYLGRRAAGLSLAVVVAARSGEAGGTEERLLALERSVGATVVQPPPLTRRAVTRLVREALATEPEEGFADACLHATGGNPLFVVELLRELVARGVQPTDEATSLVGTVGPSAVARLTLARLETMGRDARELATAVAVFGDGTDPALAAEATAMSAQRARLAADRLSMAGIFARERPLAFAHPIVRAAIYERLPPGARAARHAAAAAQLARVGASPERTAAHLLRASPADDPVRVTALVEAARVAVARGAPDSALAYLRRALKEPPRVAERPGLLLELGRIEHDLQEYDEAEEHLRGALASQSVRIRADAARWLARTLMSCGRAHESLSHFDSEVDALAQEAPDLALELESELLLAARWVPHGEMNLGPRLARFEQRVMRCPRAHAVAGFHRALARLLEGATSAEVGDRIAAALDAGAIDPLDPSYGWAIRCAVHSEREDLGLALVEPALRRARELGRLSQLPLLFAQRAQLVYARGEVANALADTEVGLRAVEGFHPALPLLHAVRIDALRERGELDEAEAGLRRAGFADGVGDAPPFGWLLASRCRLRLAQDRLPEARDDFERGERLHERLGASKVVHPDWRAYGALALARLGEHARAQRGAGRQLELARRFGAPRGLGTALRAAGLVAGGEAGLARLEEAVQVLEASPARLVLAQALSDQGALLRALGRRKESREPLRRAIAIAGECGARALAQRAHAEQRAGGGRPPPVETQGLGALTPAERRVVALAARGESNREIAQALFVTEKTVEVHLTRAYRKLDIRSRWQLRDFGAAHSPT